MLHPRATRRGRACLPAFGVEPLESRRLLSAGQLDPTFGAGGAVTTDFVGDVDDRASAVAVQADGKYVVAGSVARPWDAESVFGVARYNVDGTLDASFGDSGRV